VQTKSDTTIIKTANWMYKRCCWRSRIKRTSCAFPMFSFISMSGKDIPDKPGITRRHKRLCWPMYRQEGTFRETMVSIDCWYDQNSFEVTHPREESKDPIADCRAGRNGMTESIVRSRRLKASAGESRMARTLSEPDRTRTSAGETVFNECRGTLIGSRI
jgi:hypothetical protein